MTGSGKGRGRLRRGPWPASRFKPRPTLGGSPGPSCRCAAHYTRRALTDSLLDSVHPHRGENAPASFVAQALSQGNQERFRQPRGVWTKAHTEPWTAALATRLDCDRELNPTHAAARLRRGPSQQASWRPSLVEKQPRRTPSSRMFCATPTAAVELGLAVLPTRLLRPSRFAKCANICALAPSYCQYCEEPRQRLWLFKRVSRLVVHRLHMDGHARQSNCWRAGSPEELDGGVQVARDHRPEELLGANGVGARRLRRKQAHQPRRHVLALFPNAGGHRAPHCRQRSLLLLHGHKSLHLRTPGERA